MGGGQMTLREQLKFFKDNFENTNRWVEITDDQSQIMIVGIYLENNENFGIHEKYLESEVTDVYFIDVVEEEFPVIMIDIKVVI